MNSYVSLCLFDSWLKRRSIWSLIAMIFAMIVAMITGVFAWFWLASWILYG